MSQRLKPIDLTQVQTTSLRKRDCQLDIEKLAENPDPARPLQEFYASLPRLGAANDLLAAGDALTQSALNDRGVIWMIDEHMLDAGLSPVLIRMIQRGLIRTLAMTGTAAVRDYEMAVQGMTREDESAGLEDGLLGLARETGEGMNTILNEGVRRGFGLGECLGRGILDRQPKYYTRSVLAACAARMVPCTIHVAIGSDGFHRHPAADGMMLGKGSLKDLQILSARLPSLHGGGTVVAAHRSLLLRDILHNSYASARNLGESVDAFSLIRIGDDAPAHEELKAARRRFQIPGPFELMVPLFAGVLFSLVE
jgi:hypothetical protein